jgi:hypothetical protein
MLADRLMQRQHQPPRPRNRASAAGNVPALDTACTSLQSDVEAPQGRIPLSPTL